MIKYRITALACILPLITSAFAQVEITARIEPSRAVLYEPVIATVRIQNHTSQRIILDDHTPGSRIWFNIEQSPGRRVRQRDPVVLGEPLIVEPRQSATRRINISRIYDIRDTGPYNVRARLDWGGESFASGRTFLDVVPGLEITRMVGPASPDGSERRLYRLLSLNRDRGEHLFLRIDDEARRICYAVLHLGRVVRIQEPTMRIDAGNNIHVLHQAGPGRFLHHAFSPSGDQVTRRMYTSEDPGVALEYGRDGAVVVSGAATSLMDGE